MIIMSMLNSQLGWFIIAILLKTVISDSQAKITASVTPSDSSFVLLSSEQYHFVPTGSFFQYSMAGWEKGDSPKLIENISVNYEVEIANKTATYNFLVFSTNGPSPYQKLNCYLRAVNEGLAQLMSSCQITENAFIAADGICQNSIRNSAQNQFASTHSFLNCSDTNLLYNISSGSSVGPLNGTILFIVDNSGLIGGIPSSSDWIHLILSYQVLTVINEEDRAKLYLFCGLTGVLIIVMVIIAVALNCKIRRIDKQMKEERKNKEE